MNARRALTKLVVPEGLHRNAPDVAAIGYEETGQALMNLATRRVGLESLINTDILDVGCGVRFCMTIINRRIPIKSYSGLEVDEPIVEFLQESVEAHDDRFRFRHWNIYNQLYNPSGFELQNHEALPFDTTFDLIWLFSVFTHLNPKDSFALLCILRRYIRKNGSLFFSAFVDHSLNDFEDRIKEQPLLNAYYGRRYLESIVEQAGWKVDAFYDRDPSNCIQHYFVCSPMGS